MIAAAARGMLIVLRVLLLAETVQIELSRYNWPPDTRVCVCFWIKYELFSALLHRIIDYI